MDAAWIFVVIAALVVLVALMVYVLPPRRDQEDDAGVAGVLRRAVAEERGLAGEVELTDEAVEDIVRLSGGDARRSLTILEAAAGAAEDGVVTPEIVELSLDAAPVRYDRDGDQHYDVTSAFIKSIRGSDVDAALHYLARMLVAGEDPRFIARRRRPTARWGRPSRCPHWRGP